MDKRYRQASDSRERSKIRVLAVAMMLSEKQFISTAQILKRLWNQYGMVCDRKTIYADMYAINRIIPIEAVAGRHGGYRKIDVLGDCEDG